jgi:hypothetical protein
MCKRKLAIIALALVAAVLGTPSKAWCDPILTLISSGGGVYDYGVTLQPNDNVSFPPFGSWQISFTGLSGVTGASATNTFSMFVPSFTSDSVTFSTKVGPILTNPLQTPVTLGDLIIDSTAPLGSVNWNLVDFEGNLSGTVSGPVGVPEPGSLSMLLPGIAGFGLLGILARRRGAPRCNRSAA